MFQGIKAMTVKFIIEENDQQQILTAFQDLISEMIENENGRTIEEKLLSALFIGVEMESLKQSRKILLTIYNYLAIISYIFNIWYLKHDLNVVNLAGDSPLKARCDIMHVYTRSERFQSGIVSRLDLDSSSGNYSCSLTVRLNEKVQAMPKTPRGRGRGRGCGRGRGSPAISTAPVPDAPVSGTTTTLENVSISVQELLIII